MIVSLALAMLLSADPEPDKAEQPRSLTREETEQLFEKAMADPQAMRFAWSAVICRWSLIRADAKREIETEKKYAREGGGVVDLGALRDEQQRMRRADERSKRARDALREWTSKPIPCKDPAMVAAVICITADWGTIELDDEWRPVCSSLKMVVLKELAYRSDSWLRR